MDFERVDAIKKPSFRRAFLVKVSDDDLLSQAVSSLSLARRRFTVLFGMGRGGSTLLWSSDKGVGIKLCGLEPAFGLSGVLIVLRLSAD